MADALQWFRTLHVLFAILWAGGGTFLQLVIKRIGREEGDLERTLWARGWHGPYLGVTSLATVVFGFLAFGSGDYDSDTLGSGFMVFNLGMAAGIAALLVGFLGHFPTDRGLQRLVQAGASDEELAPLRRRDHRLDTTSTILVSIALLAMVSFRLSA